MNKKHVLKGLGGMFIIFLLCLMTGQLSYADLIFEPEDAFYSSHKAKCDYIPRAYTANGAEGSVILWKSPESHKKISALKNGKEFYVSYLYTDKSDTVWGYAEIYKDASSAPKKQCSGWLKIKDLKIVYDAIEFYKEHKDELKDYKGELDGYTSDSPIQIWTFPGSGKTYGQIDKLDEMHRIVCTYQDAEDRLWGYYAYTAADNWKTEFTNRSSRWICISDPTNTDIPAIQYEQPTTIPASEANVFASSKSDSNMFLLIGIAVGLLVIVTGILIRNFWRNSTKHK